MGSPSTPGVERPWRWWDLVVLAVVVALVFALTGGHPAFGSSAREVEVCREMVERGDLIVPHFGYVPYLGQPILTFWLGALSQGWFGSGAWAAHLPSALAALVSLVATYLLGATWRGRLFGLGAAGLLLGSGGFLVMTSVLSAQAIVTACLAMAWAGFGIWEIRGRQGTGRWWWWAGVGLAVLAQGTGAIVGSALVVVGYGALRGGLGEVRRLLIALGPVAGLGILLVITLPWYLALWHRDPALLHLHLQLGVGSLPGGTSSGAWWSVGPALVAWLAPLSVIAVPLVVFHVLGVVRAVARRQPCEPMILLVSLVVLLTVLGQAVGVGSLMAMMPILALIMAEGLRQGAGSARWPRIVLVLQAALMALVVAWAASAIANLPRGTRIEVVVGQGLSLGRLDPTALPHVLLVLLVLGTGTVIAAAVRRLPTALGVLGATGLVLVTLVLPRLPEALPDLDHRRLAERILADDPHAPVVVDGAVAEEGAILLTLRQRVPYVGPVGILAPGYRYEQGVSPLIGGEPVSGDTLTGNPWLWSRATLATRWRGPGRIWLIGDRSLQEGMIAAGLSLVEVDRARRSVLWTNRPLP